MTTDPTVSDTVEDTGTESFADLPIQPTGSGVADLEIAYEQMKLSEDADAIGPDAGMTDATNGHDAASIPTDTGPAAIESAAHPN